jgi:hypothetical protein
MITILNHELPNRVTELTIAQFEAITAINSNEELDPIEKHLKVFEYLGIPESEFSDTDIDTFISMVKDFNASQKEDLSQVTEIELEGYKYIGEFKLSVRDTKLIEKSIMSKDAGYISQIVAIMFKREDLTNTEHYAEAHLKHKAKLFKELKANIAIPYLTFIAQKINQQTKNEVTEVVE